MTSGNKLSRIIAVLLCAVLTIGVVLFIAPATTVSAAAGHWENAYNEGNPDEQIIQIGLYGYTKNSKLTITIDITKNEFDIAKVSGCDKKLVSKSSGEIKIKNFEFTKNVTIKITVTQATDLKYEVKLGSEKIAEYTRTDKSAKDPTKYVNVTKEGKAQGGIAVYANAKNGLKFSVKCTTDKDSVKGKFEAEEE